MLLLDDGEGGIVGVDPRIRDKVRAYLLADRLDRTLAAGVSPESNASLALRAQVLASTSMRNRLAAGLERIIREASEPTTKLVNIRVPLSRRAIRENGRGLEEIRRRLSSSDLLPVSCIAQASVLLTAGSSPLFCDRGADDHLAHAVQSMVSGLTFDL